MSAHLRVALSACVIVLAISTAACQQRRRPMPATEAPPQPTGPAEIQKIQALEDRRSLGGGQLVEWARTHPDADVRARALLALARIQAPSTSEAMGDALTDAAPAPRAEAAFAAGTLGAWQTLPEDKRDALVQKLLDAEAAETDISVRVAQLEALGKIATPAAVERLVDRLYGTPPAVEARAALSLGVAAKAGAQLPPRVLTALSPLLRAEANPGSRFAAAYALAMSRLPGARPALLICARDTENEVRLLCARGLGEVGTDTDAVTLRALLDDPDYRVVVEATRALAKLAARCKGQVCPAIGALADLSYRVERLERGDVAGGGQPLLALAQAGLPASGRTLLTTLRSQVVAAAGRVQGPLRQDLANLDCRLAAALDRQEGQMAEVLTCGGGLISEVRRLRLGLTEVGASPEGDPEKKVAVIAPYLRHADPTVRNAAVRALGGTKSKAAAEHIRPLITNGDLILASNAAWAAGEVGDTGAIPAIRQLAPKVAEKTPENVQAITEALAALQAKDAEPELRAYLSHPHRHVRLSAAQALAKLTGAPVEVPEVESPETTFRAPHLSKDAKLIIRTEKGDIEVKLYEDAPMTAGHMQQLSRRGFFRKGSFHRVVPDFVVQGGDPRGDGEGGPGVTIRDEINHHPYARGVVGMALSGPDTGGSQFFITHSPQPHLDGRYTAFGEVVSGREVVDQILEGDVILDIRAQ